LFWTHYERFEWTRLKETREQMMLHKTLKKENVLGNNDNYIWTYVIRPKK